MPIITLIIGEVLCPWLIFGYGLGYLLDDFGIVLDSQTTIVVAIALVDGDGHTLIVVVSAVEEVLHIQLGRIGIDADSTDYAQ